MKTQMMKKTLAALALGGLVLMASGAQAEDNRGNYGYGHSNYSDNYSNDYSNNYSNDNSSPFNPPQQGGHAYQQSQYFSQQIDARQARQMDRIQAGKRSGSLTRFEFRDLMQAQNRIRAMEQHALADGIINPREYQRLDRALDSASRDIRFEKIDQQARNNRSHNPWLN